MMRRKANSVAVSYLPRKTRCTTRRTNWSSSCYQITAQCWLPTQPT